MYQKIDLRRFYREIERDGVRPTYVASAFHKLALENPDKFRISETFAAPDGKKMVEITLKREGVRV
jgi:hypothetical protein